MRTCLESTCPNLALFQMCAMLWFLVDQSWIQRLYNVKLSYSQELYNLFIHYVIQDTGCIRDIGEIIVLQLIKFSRQQSITSILQLCAYLPITYSPIITYFAVVLLNLLLYFESSLKYMVQIYTIRKYEREKKSEYMCILYQPLKTSSCRPLNPRQKEYLV